MATPEQLQELVQQIAQLNATVATQQQELVALRAAQASTGAASSFSTAQPKVGATLHDRPISPGDILKGLVEISRFGDISTTKIWLDWSFIILTSNVSDYKYLTMSPLHNSTFYLSNFSCRLFSFITSFTKKLEAVKDK